eukprot:11478062-Alexandrium_andersonii.AAC.1
MIDCYRVPKELDYAAKAKEATAKLFSESKRLREEGQAAQVIKDRLGPRHIHAFNAAVAVLLEHKQADSELTAQIRQTLAEWQPHGWKGLATSIRHWGGPR